MVWWCVECVTCVRRDRLWPPGPAVHLGPVDGAGRGVVRAPERASAMDEGRVAATRCASMRCASALDMSPSPCSRQSATRTPEALKVRVRDRSRVSQRLTLECVAPR
eukprot:3256320-Rhodomonas_salina.1